MADQNRSENQSSAERGTPTESKGSRTGDPGRTPGKAEGEEDTAEESLSERDSPPLH